MSENRSRLGLARRLFLSRLGAGAASLGAVFGAGVVPVQAQSAEAGRWQPASHAEDDWFDQVPGKHRIFFDTTRPNALGEALLFANNFFVANKSGYGLGDSDLAVVVCVRHQSTPFAFTDAIWAKYSAIIAERSGATDPKTKGAPTMNLYRADGYGRSLPNNGNTLDALFKRGMRLAVCNQATRGYATAIAEKTGSTADEVYKELTEHLVPNSRLVPAGIVAVNRAQEHGFSFAYVG